MPNTEYDCKRQGWESCHHKRTMESLHGWCGDLNKGRINNKPPELIDSNWDINRNLISKAYRKTRDYAGYSYTCDVKADQRWYIDFKKNGLIIDDDLNIFKTDGTNYICPSYDNKKCIKASNKNQTKLVLPSEAKLYTISCLTPDQLYTKSEELILPEGMCKQKFDYYNLFPSENPYLVRQRNINQNYPNKITNSEKLSEIANNYPTVFKNVNKDGETNQDFNKLLENGPLKLACCNTKDLNNLKKYNFKVPLNIDDENIKTKKFKYQYNSIDIPEKSCPVDFQKYNSNCNAFMNIYCDNMYIEFKKLNLPESEFQDYCPECACYAPRTKEQELYPYGSPSKCYKDGCEDNSVSYLDSSSQGQICSSTICQNIINAADITSGGDAIISGNLQNNCGDYIPKKEIKENNDKIDLPETNNQNTIKTENIIQNTNIEVEEESLINLNSLIYIIGGGSFLIFCICSLFIIIIIVLLSK